jgi:hypothetical protein
MPRDRFTFEGLDEIERRIRRRAEHIGYLTLTDRTERSAEEPLGRFDFNAADALPYLEPGDDDAEDDEVEGDDDNGDDDAAPSALAAASVDPGAADIANAACRWLRDIATRNTYGEPYKRFRVRAYGFKAIRVVDSGSFLCRNEEHDLELPEVAATGDGPETELRIPTPTFEEAANHGAARGLKALGDYYAQWGQIVLGSMGQLQGINNSMLSRLHRDLQSSRDQVDTLVASILEVRVAEMQAAEERRTNVRAEDTRAELAKHAIAQLGDAAKVYLASRGVSPELAELVGPLAQSPELVQTLMDPEVRTLLNDPQNLRFLAAMLRQVVEQAKAARQAPPAEQAA